jgi:hypothetical protein
MNYQPPAMMCRAVNCKQRHECYRYRSHAGPEQQYRDTFLDPEHPRAQCRWIVPICDVVPDACRPCSEIDAALRLVEGAVGSMGSTLPDGDLFGEEGDRGEFAPAQ